MNSTLPLHVLQKLFLTIHFKKASINEYIVKNIAEGLECDINKADTPEPLSDNQINLLINAKLNIYDRFFAYALLFCGCRRGEDLALTVGDIMDGDMTISKNCVYPSNQAVIENHTKTAAGERKVPMPTDFFNDLTAAIIEDKRKELTSLKVVSIKIPPKA